MLVEVELSEALEAAVAPVSAVEVLGKQDIVVEDDGSGCLRLLPHRHGTDGFFAAVWQRQ